MLRKFLASALVLAAFNNAIAQEDSTKTGPVIAGFADAYYRYDFGKNALNNKTSFTNSHNSFELGMASIKFEHSIGKASVVADLGFGKRAEEFSYNDDKTRFAIKQLYLSYQLAESLKLTAGSWATHVGYELVDPHLSRNYSMSYMFSYGPFFHTGVKADATFGAHNFMVGITNPTDFKSTTSKFKYLIAQYSTASSNGKVKAYLNYQGGKGSDSTNMNQLDGVLSATLSDKFSLGYNGTVQFHKSESPFKKTTEASKWWGSAVYLNYDPTSWFGLTLRSEYFKDQDQVTSVFAGAPKGGRVFANTLSANFKVNNLTFIPELRFEKANEAIFVKSTDAATDKAASLLFAAVYHF